MKNISILLLLLLLTGCVAIPKETVTLSQTMGNDLHVLHKAHRTIVSIHYKKIKDDINAFIDDIYAPFVINYVLKRDLENYKSGDPSLFGAIELAGQKPGKEETENALKEMSDFQTAARRRIESQRESLMLPINEQEDQILLAVDQSYKNLIDANSTITGYLESVREVKSTQQEALKTIGLGGIDTLINNSIINLSDNVGIALNKAKEIDIKSDNAYNQLDEIINEIKKLTNKK